MYSYSSTLLLTALPTCDFTLLAKTIFQQIRPVSSIVDTEHQYYEYGYVRTNWDIYIQ